MIRSCNSESSFQSFLIASSQAKPRKPSVSGDPDIFQSFLIASAGVSSGTTLAENTWCTTFSLFLLLQVCDSDRLSDFAVSLLNHFQSFLIASLELASIHGRRPFVLFHFQSFLIASMLRVQRRGTEAIFEPILSVFSYCFCSIIYSNFNAPDRRCNLSVFSYCFSKEREQTGQLTANATTRPFSLFLLLPA